MKGKILHPQKEKYYCGRKCANIRLDDKSESKTILCSKCLLQKNVNKRSKQKICNSCQIKPKRKLRNLVEFICEVCNKNFQDKKSRVYCSKSCSTIKRNKDGMARKAGLKSVHSQSRRSKNEIAFANLCINKFTKVLTNEPLFNGWDADIIIEDLKVAILWNGVWHYKKITEKHSLLQIQNRDSIKIDEIVKSGYIPYVIKDMGKFSMEKVEGEWLKFNEWIESFKF